MSVSRTKLSLACASYSFENPNLSTVLNKIKRLGFSLVDLGWPQINMKNLDLAQAKDTLQEIDIDVYTLSVVAPDLTSDCFKQWYQHGLLLLRQSLDVASQLGAKKIGLVVNSYASNSSPRRALLQVIKSLRNIAPDCENFKIPICVEIHPRGPINGLVDAQMIRQEVASPWIGYTLDTSLLTWLSINLKKAVFNLRNCPLNIHLRELTDHDFFGIPGRGKIDFESFFRNLTEIGCSEPYIIELFRTRENFGVDLEQGISEAKYYLEELIRQIG